MADFKKYFLDFEGLEEYDRLIKLYIDGIQDGNNGELANIKADLATLMAGADTEGSVDQKVKDAVDALDEKLTEDLTALDEREAADKEELEGAISDLDEKVDQAVEDLEGKIEEDVEAAVQKIIDGASDAFDTLKEVEEWIQNDETGTAALINRVAANEEAIEALQQKDEDLKEYIDAQDKDYFDSILSIEELKIASLFSVTQAADKTAAEVIADVPAGGAVKLTANQEIGEDLVIDKPMYIDANGSTFTGTVTIPADVDVIIENATFSNPVVVA